VGGIKEKVIRCFSSVFPDLSEEEIYRASTTSLASWDSVAHVTLLSTISEEFEQSFEFEDFEELVSYSLIVEHLEEKLRKG
jgi:acyl carrier protein